MDQPGKVANPARGSLNRENVSFPCSAGHEQDSQPYPVKKKIERS